MKIKSAIILILFLFQLSANAQQTYQLDVKKSKILWKLKSTGGHYGYLLFNSGTLNYSAAGAPADGLFVMDMNTIRSTDHEDAAANQKVDKEMRGPGFFNIDKYTAATMTVKQIIKTGTANTYKVTGDLNIKGIIKPIEFTAVIKPNGNTLTATAEFTIDRAQWDIHVQPKKKEWDFVATLKDHVIANDIYITLNLVLNK